MKSVETAFKKAVRLSKLKGKVSPNTLRHIAATWLMQIGVSTWEAAGSLIIRLDNFETKPLKSQRHKIRMVADAVLVEPVSTPKFPANRKITGNFSILGQIAAQRSLFAQ
jgi:hypothetical protein